MNLATALRIPDRAVVAIVGGGGKTSALYRLAAELAEPGLGRVLLATTAKMFLPQEHEADGLFINADFDAIAHRLESTIPYLRRILVAPDLLETPEGWKLASVPLDWPRRLSRLVRVSGVLVEADGSRHLPFKAPADYEPPIPPDADLVVVVVGLDGLGQPLDETHVHRPEIVAALAGAKLGVTVDGAMVARVLTHAQGGLKNIPARARAVVLLNKVTDDNLEAARQLADEVLASDRYEAVLLGAVQDADPIRERRARIGAVALAAGGASRFGAAKLALPWQGTTLVGHALRVAQASGATEIVLVTGAHAEAVRAALASTPPPFVGEGPGEGLPRQPRFTIVHNGDWQEGLSTSVKAGLGALSERVQAALFLLADQPTITPAIVQAIVQRYYETAAPIVVPTFGGKRGNPTLFDRSLWPELMAVTGDQGGRGLIERYRDRVAFVEVGEAVAVDVDTPDDYQRLTNSSPSP
ncbi:MAG: putative selenium-dependent hydroxylase accessory protein YqeC [Anaerolineae bacterium]|nr:putative selenium-dependent hydroxylase accessory protein YqeC [Anaerolineae bacterium]